jgi:hypothetical protein
MTTKKTSPIKPSKKEAKGKLSDDRPTKTKVMVEDIKQEPKIPLYAFRVELKSIKPKIWRNFYVPSDISLAIFNEVIIRVMGWNGYHLFSFTIFDEEYYNPDTGNLTIGMDLFTKSEPIDDEEFQDLTKISLDQLGLKKNNTFYYLYDFGDDWHHSLKVLSTDYVPTIPGTEFGCFGGERACPPEDCGGPWNYDSMLKILADPSHEEYEETMDFLEEDFDPEDFDPDEIHGFLQNFTKFDYLRGLPKRFKKK